MIRNPDAPIQSIARKATEQAGRKITERAVRQALRLDGLSVAGIKLATAAVVLGLTEPYVQRLSRRWGIYWTDYTPYEKRGAETAAFLKLS